MFSENYRREFTEPPTVEELIEILGEYPPTAKVSVLGDPMFYIHGESDGSLIVFDDASMDDEYE